jgi:hypothetical protein
MMAKKGIDNGEDCDNIPESMRQLLAMQAMESGKPFAPHLLGRPQGPMAQYGNGNMLMNGDPNGSGKVGMFFFPACFRKLFKTKLQQSSTTLPAALSALAPGAV